MASEQEQDPIHLGIAQGQCSRSTVGGVTSLHHVLIPSGRMHVNKCCLGVWVHLISSPLPACTPPSPAPSLAPLPTAVELQHGKSLFQVPSFPHPYRREDISSLERLVQFST